MRTPLESLLRRIRASGPLPFEEFHAFALYDPEYGFFASGPLRSAEAGDFLTSPEVSPVFGASLAVFVRNERGRLGDPEDFVVIDAGAGSGSLLRSLLEAEPATAWATELSPAARKALASVIPAARIVGSVSDLPQHLTGVVIANELLDNMPVALAVRVGGGWEERWVAASSGRLELVAAPARDAVMEWCEYYAGAVAEGGLVEVQKAACDWLGVVLARLHAGALVIIDYGDTAEGLASRRPQGTLRTYRSHHVGPDPLQEPGATDITVDVNFTALVTIARRAGYAVDLVRQEEFLTGLGLRDRLRELRYRELELAGSGDELRRLEVRSERIGAETLLHPRGLGDFRVMVARKEPDAAAETSER